MIIEQFINGLYHIQNNIIMGKNKLKKGDLVISEDIITKHQWIYILDKQKKQMNL